MCRKITPKNGLIYLLLFVASMTGAKILSAQDTVIVEFQCGQVEVGDQICVPVQVSGFVNIASVTLLFTWDPTVLSLDDVQNEFFDPAGVWNDPGPNDLRYIWVDQMVNGQTLPDGTTFLEICFTAIGPPGSSSVVDVVPFVLNPNSITEFGNPDAQVIPYQSEPCTIEVVGAQELLAIVRTCGSPDGIANGSFTVIAAGGTGPFTYSWTGPVNGSGNLAAVGDSDSQSVPPGNYTITVTDNASGSNEVYMITIAGLELESVITVVREITCYTFSNGRIEVGAFNGTHPISVLWRNLQNPLYHGSGYLDDASDFYTLNSLPVGAYEISLIDSEGCEKKDTITLSATPIVVDVMTSNATCNGTTDGTAMISFSGGRPYSGGIYEITPGWGGGSTMNTSPIVAPALGVGEYWVEVCDSINNCCVRDTFTIGADTVISASVIATPPLCSGTPTGQIQALGLINGDVVMQAIYLFTLYDSNNNPVGTPVPGSLVNYSDLAAGNYSLVVTRGLCMSDTIEVVVPLREPLSLTLLSVGASGCVQGQNTGMASVLASGGTPGYSYSWDGGAHTGPTVTGLSAGNHSVTVTDNNECTALLTVNIPQATGPTILDIVPSNVGCMGGDVTLEVIYTEGTSPVSDIIWSTGDSTAVITGVGPGTVSVTIRDSLFCFDIAFYEVPDAPMIDIDSIHVESPTCGGDTDGQITVFASGGTEPYTYYWSTGDTTNFNLLAGLGAGSYGVTIVDSDTCDVMADTLILMPDPPAPTFAFNNIQGTGCADTCDGIATLTPANGIPGFPYTFFWDCGLMESGNQSTAFCLCPGYNRVVITQDNLCFYEDSVFIPSPEPLGVDTLMLNDVSCYGRADGAIAISGRGGTGPYTYQWNVPGSNGMLSGLEAGMYVLTLTDVQGCMSEYVFQIAEPDSLILSVDSNALRPISCNFANSGSITLEVMGGSGGYEFVWSPNVSSGFIASGVPAGTYQITVTDDAGCTDTTSVTLIGPEPVVSFLPMIDDPLCFGDLTLVTVDSATGGNGGYLWNVNGGAPNPLDSVVWLPAGIYNIITLDSTGCRDTVQIILNNPPPIEIQVLPEEPTLDLGDSILLQVFIDGSQLGIDSVVWSPDDGMLSCIACPSPFASNVIPTQYTVTVWDTNGCMASLDVLVNVDNTRHVFIPNAFSPNFDGYNDDLELFVGEGVTRVRSIRIFDRWGALMTETTDIDPIQGGIKIWDGSYRNKMMMPGVYVYMIQIEFADREVLTYRGDITLVR